MTKINYDDVNSPDPSKHLAGAGEIDMTTLNTMMEKFGFSTTKFTFGGNPFLPDDSKDESE
eukprot:CAMPEP_0176451784 /NCGR_PEP_ID=MMETSP0127-20121128/28088_1 /TAXON_ID=938130 /ORGANISM="Platyophrya macrostoma, Strain WH" /LENGTH=60 /DNA_ID=CAMNT_0017839997 /DNA_START=55 /DNA_END=237 /DNA_ORIENTATION=+